jgi:methionyl aminopeptidase
MVNAGAAATRLDAVDGWTVRTDDGSLSAQFEHTIVITDGEPQVLTLP